MRIVAHNGARIWGGAERATTLLLRGLSDRGHQVTLLCNDPLVVSGARSMGVPAALSPIGGDIALPHAFRFARHLKQLQPDALIIGTYKKLFLAALGARLAGVPLVVARVGLETDTARSAKYVFALRYFVDRVVVNAERMLPHFTNVRLIHNGVRQPQPAASPGLLRRQLGIAPDAFVIGNIARLAKQKRIDRLLESLAMLPAQVECIIAGDGEEREMLQSVASANSKTARRVHFLGHRQDHGAVLEALDALVITSDREGLSNSMLEAMAAAVPVVTTPVSGASDAIIPEDPGGIITGFEPAELARAVSELMLDRPRRLAMADAARRRAEKQFSIDGMLDRWEDLLRQPSRR
jgi:glycosyltransferase involved in cell wall biosynthesis